MFNIFSPRLNFFALNISDLSLRVAQIESRNKRLAKFAFSQIELSDDVLDEGEIKNEERFISSLQNVLKTAKPAKITAKYAAVCLPDEYAFIDVLRLPVLKAEEIPKAVMFEAANYIPLPIDDVYLDYEVINCPNSALKNCVEVLIAAVPKKIINNYNSVLKKAGLSMVFVETESISLVRALIQKNIAHKPILIIDFGRSRTGLCTFAGGSLRFTSTIPISSLELDNVLSRELKISLDKAREIRQGQGLWAKGEALEAMVPALTDFTEQIKKHIDYYGSHTANKHLPKEVEKLILCGNGAGLKGLADFLAQSLHTKIELGNPWINVLPALSKQMPPLPIEQALSFAAPIGLALSGLKL